MTQTPYVPAKHKLTAFNCPLCRAYALQYWANMGRAAHGGFEFVAGCEMSTCSHCGKSVYWYDKQVVVPDLSAAPPVNEDLNEDIKKDYNEAASIIAKSPRGAAALLRLCVQKLCKQLGEKGEHLNQDIGNLVKKGTRRKGATSTRYCPRHR